MTKKIHWKKIGKIAGITLAVLVLLNFGINYFIKQKLPKIIEDQNDTAYDFKYADLSYSIWNSSVQITGVDVHPKKGSNIKKDIDFYGTVEGIKVTGVNFFKLLSTKNLDAYTIYIQKPEITVLEPVVKDTVKSKSKLSQVIDINQISIQNAHLTYLNNDAQKKLHEVHNLNLNLYGIHMGQYTVDKNIPFTYTDYAIHIDSAFTQLNEVHQVKTGEIIVDNKQFFMDKFLLYPDISKKNFQEETTETNTRMRVEIPKMHLQGTDWGYKKQDFYVNIKGIEIDEAAFQILDQKDQTVFQEAKKEASKIIQPLIPFEINVNQILIKKSTFTSTNQIKATDVNIEINNISNKVKKALTVDQIKLKNPVFTHFYQPKKIKTKSNNDLELNDHISIKSFDVINAQYKYVENKKEMVSVADFNLSLENIQVDDQTILQSIPFTYEKEVLKTGKMRYDTGDFYNITSDGIVYKNDNFELLNLKMTPKYSRAIHTSKLKYASDRYTIQSGKIALQQMKWGLDAAGVFYLKASRLVANALDCNIYRSTLPPTEQVNNDMYSKKLRNLPIGLQIDEIKIVNSKLLYEEEDKNSVSPGKLTFANFNGTIRNISSGYHKSQLPNTTVDVQTTFMNVAPLTAHWEFNILNQADAFKINGAITNFPAKGMNPFIKPYLKVGVDGMLKKVVFNFSGNNKVATGNFGMNYDDLKITLFDKEAKKERKLLSKVGNLFLQNSTKNTTQEQAIKPVERKPECSFFNYLWLCVLQGLKQTLI